MNIGKTLAGLAKKAFGHYTEIIIAVLPCIVIASLSRIIGNFLTEMPFAQGQPLSAVYPVAADWGAFLNLFYDAGIMLMPVALCWSSVRHFGGTDIFGIVAGLCLVPASFISPFEIGGRAISELPALDLGIVRVPMTGFHAQILAPILAGVVLFYLEKGLKKVIPELVSFMFIPLLSVFGAVFLTYTVIGPAARVVENGLAAFADILLNTPSFRVIGGLIFGVLMMPMGMFGLHLAIMPVQIREITVTGLSSIWPLMQTFVLSCGGAALAAFIATRDARTPEEKKLHENAKQGAVITLGVGTMEPALFGVCTVNRCAFVGAICGSGIGGALDRLLDIGTTAFGANGFFTLLVTPVDRMLAQLAVLLIAVAISFTVTFILMKASRRRDTIRS